MRLAENPRDIAAGLRVFQLLPGIGPKRARQFADVLVDAGGVFAALADVTVPSAAVNDWPKLIDLMERLTGNTVPDLQSQVRLAYSRDRLRYR